MGVVPKLGAEVLLLLNLMLGEVTSDEELSNRVLVYNTLDTLFYFSHLFSFESQVLVRSK